MHGVSRCETLGVLALRVLHDGVEVSCVHCKAETCGEREREIKVVCIRDKIFQWNGQSDANGLYQ